MVGLHKCDAREKLVISPDRCSVVFVGKDVRNNGFATIAMGDM